jgi:hypothetical protein
MRFPPLAALFFCTAALELGPSREVAGDAKLGSS